MRSRENVLNKTEYNRLWKVARKDELNRLLFVLMAQLGLRRGEVEHIKASWVDFQDQIVEIPPREGDWEPKTKNSIRRIPYRELTKSEKVLSQYFQFQDQVDLSGTAIYNRVRKWGRKAEIKKKVTPHTLRATSATKFASAGLSTQALKTLMGWSDLQTAERYIKNSSRAVERELEKYGDQIY